MGRLEFPRQTRAADQTFPEPPICDCARGEIRRRRLANGIAIHVKQCLNCGRMRPVAKASLNAGEIAAPFVDVALRERWEEQQANFWRHRSDSYHQQRQAESDAWWETYNA